LRVNKIDQRLRDYIIQTGSAKVDFIYRQMYIKLLIIS
jgi:hypothetical protein